MTDANKDGRLHSSSGLSKVADGTKHESADGSTHTIMLRSEQQLTGIVETEQLITFVNDFANYYRRAMSDGKFDMNDAFGAVSVAPSAWEGVSGSQLIPKEFLDATGEERSKIFLELYNAVINLGKAFTGK